MNRFKSNLTAQIALYDEIYTLEEQKKDALLHNNILQLEDVINAEEEKLQATLKLEKERLLLLKEYKAQLVARNQWKESEKFTLNDVFDREESLTSVREHLEQQLISIKDLTLLNAEMIQQSMKTVNFILESLTQHDSGYPNTPQPQGKTVHLLDKSI